MSRITVTKKQLTVIFSGLGEYVRRKQWFNFRCPYHNGTRFNFGVDIGAGIFKCLGCEEEGGLLRLYIDLRSGAGGAAIWGRGLLLPAEASEVMDGTSSAAPDVSQTIDHDANTRWFWKGYHSCKDAGLHGSQSMVSATDYLDKRRVDYRTVEVGIHDNMPGRVVFPFIENEKVVYYMGRAFENIPLKTINPDSDGGWLHKSDVLWQLPNLGKGVVVCEGIFDAIGVNQSTVAINRNITATCLLGKTISEKQLRLLKKRANWVVVMLDADANKDARALSLKLYGAGLNVHCCQWPENINFKGKFKDPGEAPGWAIAYLIDEAKLITPELEFRWLLEFA